MQFALIYTWDSQYCVERGVFYDSFLAKIKSLNNETHTWKHLLNFIYSVNRVQTCKTSADKVSIFAGNSMISALKPSVTAFWTWLIVSSDALTTAHLRIKFSDVNDLASRLIEAAREPEIKSIMKKYNCHIILTYIKNSLCIYIYLHSFCHKMNKIKNKNGTSKRVFVLLWVTWFSNNTNRYSRTLRRVPRPCKVWETIETLLSTLEEGWGITYVKSIVVHEILLFYWQS